MFRRWTPLLAVLLVLVVIITTLLRALGAGGPSDSPWPFPWLRPETVRPPAACLRDPAGLPVPTGPEGRPANYLHTCGNGLFDTQGQEARIFGINWSGMEYSDYAPHGLAERNWQELLDQIAALGYNTVRLPFTNETLEPGRRVANINTQLNPDLEGLTGLEMLDQLVAGARARGLKVILDRHRPTPYADNSLWYNEDVPEQRWLDDWRMLAARYKGNDTVIGVDLHNEPHGPATWGTGDPATDWRLAAERAGRAVLEANPYLLVFVEGVEHYNGRKTWWGGNLQGVRTAPVRLPVSNRVVYSPHDYGPNISWQASFSHPRFPANMPEEWDRNWGYIQREGLAPVVVGEFGGLSVGNDVEGQWQRALVAYLRARNVGAIVWSLNPSWDTGGVLAADWLTVDQAKLAAYAALRAAPIAGALPAPEKTPGAARVLLRRAEEGAGGRDIAFAFRVFNDGKQPLDLTKVELRYWFRAGDLSADELRSLAAQAEIGGNLKAEIVPVREEGPDYYLRLRFAPEAEPLAGYRATETISVRLRYLKRAEGAAALDYSYQGNAEGQERLVEWERVALYRDGRLVWGREPDGVAAPPPHLSGSVPEPGG